MCSRSRGLGTFHHRQGDRPAPAVSYVTAAPVDEYTARAPTVYAAPVHGTPTHVVEYDTPVTVVHGAPAQATLVTVVEYFTLAPASCVAASAPVVDCGAPAVNAAFRPTCLNSSRLRLSLSALGCAIGTQHLYPSWVICACVSGERCTYTCRWTHLACVRAHLACTAGCAVPTSVVECPGGASWVRSTSTSCGVHCGCRGRCTLTCRLR